jgi:S-(hydroxymethyl)glutathione dehydrogenase/alcohol dehydrogenase
VNAAREDAPARIREIAASQGVDVFIDNTGLPQVIEMGYRLVNAKGRIVLVGVPKSGNDISIHSLPLHFGKLISGSHGGETIPERDIPRYHALFKAGRLKLRELLTDRYRLDDINEAIGRMRDGRISGRCLIALSPV